MRSNALDEVIGFPQQCIMNACGASGASMPPKKLGIFFLKRKKKLVKNYEIWSYCFSAACPNPMPEGEKDRKRERPYLC